MRGELRPRSGLCRKRRGLFFVPTFPIIKGVAMQGAKFAPTDDQRETVQEWTAFGLPQSAIARHIGIDEKTLRKYFAEELANGLNVAVAKVAGSLFKQAISGNDGPAVTAKIFFLKTRGGWKETQHVELSQKLTPEERKAKIAAILGGSRKSD